MYYTARLYVELVSVGLLPSLLITIRPTKQKRISLITFSKPPKNTCTHKHIHSKPRSILYRLMYIYVENTAIVNTHHMRITLLPVRIVITIENCWMTCLYPSRRCSKNIGALSSQKYIYKI